MPSASALSNGAICRATCACTVRGTFCRVGDIAEANRLLNGQKSIAIGEAEKLIASIGAKVERPLRVIKRKFGFVKAGYRRLKKNMAKIVTLYVLSNLWVVRG